MRTNNFTEILKWAKETGAKYFYTKSPNAYYEYRDGKIWNIFGRLNNEELTNLALIGEYSTERYEKEFTYEEIEQAILKKTVKYIRTGKTYILYWNDKEHEYSDFWNHKVPCFGL